MIKAQLQYHKKHFNKVFTHDITEAMLVFQNNETATMLVPQTSPVGVELFFSLLFQKSRIDAGNVSENAL